MLAYGVRKIDRTFELRLRDLAGEESEAIVLPFCENPHFSADNRWFAWRVGMSEEKREELTEAKQPVRTGVGLRRLADGEERAFEEIQSFTFDETGRFIALLGYAPDEPKGAGSSLIVVELATDTRTIIGNVSELSWSDVGSILAITLTTGDALGSGVQTYDAASGRLRSLDTTHSKYSGLTWREDAADLAVLRSLEPAKKDGEAHAVLAWRGLDADEPRTFVLSPSDAGVAESLVVSEHAHPRWAKDGGSIAIGLRPPKEKDEPDEEKDESKGPANESKESKEKKPKLPGLQIWHTSDVRIFPGQKASESRDQKRTLLALWHLENDRVVQIGTDLMERAELAQGWDRAFEAISLPYPWGNMFGRPYLDLWLVDTHSGEREKILERVRHTYWSAEGNYLLWFDGEHYWSIDLRTKKRTNLTKNIEAQFADTLYDTPTDLLPPHGVGGWLEGDAAVFLYDRFDVWRVAPDGSGGQRITRGAREEIEHRIVDLDFEEEAIDPTAPLYFRIRSERTEARGFARLTPGAATANQLVLRDRSLGGLMKAKEADVYLYRVESRDDSPDLFVTGPDLASPRQVTRSNPFQSEFAWTHAELVNFTSEGGRELQAALLFPVNHDPSKRYPCIVYTYEILAPQIHNYELPDERSYYNFITWTQHGYFVLMPDIVYKAREPGISAIESVRAAVKKTVDMGLVDAKRVGLIGHSWGGYQAAYLPTRIDTFAASVAGAPLTDFVSFMGQIHWNPGMAEVSHWETGQARMEVPYWEDPEAHHRNSPIHKIQDLETPLLMAFGNEDGVVDWDQGTEFYNFARRAGKQMVLLVYEGEDHGFREEANQVDYHRRILEWFGHYLKGEPAPTWITEGIALDALEEEQRRIAEKETEKPAPKPEPRKVRL